MQSFDEVDAHARRQSDVRRPVAAILSFAALAISLAGCKHSLSPVQVVSELRASNPPHQVLPFRHDDFPAALAQAKREKKPIFVDAWAPWCHSCLSLRAYVLTDPSLAKVAKDYVWLSIDTEKESNGDFVTRYPHSAVPTLWVIDPATEKPLLKWTGGATAEELVTLLSDLRAGAAGPGEAFVRGNRAVAAGDLAAAEQEFRAALEKAPDGHPQRPRIVSALVNALYDRKDLSACAAVAAESGAKLPLGTARAFVLTLGLSCAREAHRDADVDVLYALALRDAKTADPRVLADDRSGLFGELVETKQARGDLAGAKEIAGAWAAFLEGEAGRAPTNDARAVFDPHRVSAYLALGEPARAIPMLQASERDFPSDYNPPARLARVYLELKRWDEADAAADRAVARVYGPRAMRVLALKADIAKARGDVPRERAALEQALARADKVALTDGQRRTRDDLAKRLAALR